jgi:signal transduction histidine kinase
VGGPADTGDARPGDARPGDARPAEPKGQEPRRWDVHPPRPSVPRSFQNRLTIAFLGIVALTLALVAPVVVNRLDDYFRQQEEQALQTHADATAAILVRFIEDSVGAKGVVAEVNGKLELNPSVRTLLTTDRLLDLATNTLAQADLTVVFGAARADTDGILMVNPDPSLSFATLLSVDPAFGQQSDPTIASVRTSVARTNRVRDWGMEITLSKPYTSRATTLAAITSLLLAMAMAALLIAVVAASLIAHRFAQPITRLTEASRRLAEGNLTSRVATEDGMGALEVQELAEQFNAMAARLEESVGIIRRDRDRSRDFLADVSHELRTPIAATRTFIELLQGPAGLDSAARAEFLDASAVQLDRLDWLAQNLLELSKLDSGLVLLDLRPDDVRGTVENGVEQQAAAAERKGITLTTTVPDRPLRISHDAPRVGQVVGNLVGNAIKFTPRGGEVQITARREADGGARIEVADTGVGIHPAELPRIFERFYRGSAANEARGTGSGLGLAIVKSIVDMHHGTIAVESRVGHGTRFTVVLPRDPEATAPVPRKPRRRRRDKDVADASAAESVPKVDDSSPTPRSARNRTPAP